MNTKRIISLVASLALVLSLSVGLTAVKKYFPALDAILRQKDPSQ